MKFGVEVYVLDLTQLFFSLLKHNVDGADDAGKAGGVSACDGEDGANNDPNVFIEIIFDRRN